MDQEFQSQISEAKPHTTSITISNPETNSSILVETLEDLHLAVEYQPPRAWVVIKATNNTEQADLPNDITLFDSLHSLIGHFSRLYRQSFQALIVQKLNFIKSNPNTSTTTTTTSTTTSTSTA